MASIEEQILKIRELRELALKGNSDEVIAKKTGFSSYQTLHFRRGLGIRARRFRDITEKSKMASFHNGRHRAEFGIPRTVIADLGCNPNQKTEFRGKVINKTLVLKFRNV